MAKLCISSSSSSRMMMLLAAGLLVLLASIQQAGPVMASVEQFAGLGEHLPGLAEYLGGDKVAKKAPEKVVNGVLTALGKHKKELQPFTKGVRKGMKLHKYLCKAQDLMAKQQNPAAAAAATSNGDDGLLFSYYVTSTNQVVVCWSSHEKPPQEVAGTGTAGRASTALLPGLNDDGRYYYYVQMTGVRVGQGPDLVVVQTTPTTTVLNRPPAPAKILLSTAQPYTYIESGMYGGVWNEVIRQTNLLNLQAPPSLNLIAAAAGKLCFYKALSVPQPRLPDIAILLAVAGNNVMQQTAAAAELGGAAGGTVWYRESPSVVCLGIRRATPVQPPVLGSMIQSGRTMTVDLTAAAGLVGTLTF